MTFHQPLAASLALALLAPLPAATLYRGAVFVTLSADAPAPKPDQTGWMLVDEHGVISALGAGDGAGDPVVDAARAQPGFAEVDLTGKIVMPGFVSGHSHLWQSPFRGIAPDGVLWPWLMALHRTYGQYFGEGDFAAFTKHGAVDQLRHGITTTYNHSHYLGGTFEDYRGQYDAELTTPQRFVFAWVNDPAANDATWRERLTPLVKAAVPAPDRPLLGFSLNPIGLFRGKDYFARELSLAHELNLTVQMHYLEQSSNQEKDRAEWPEIVASGAVDKHTSFAHFIHTDDHILKAAAAAGASMVWNPLSNGRLGSGLPEIELYLQTGLRVGMGVDGQASGDISDPFENVRLGLYALRMRREDAAGLQPVDVLRLHTLKTAEVLGVEKWVGSLEPGKFADFLVVDPGEPGTGPVWDVAATLVFACSSRNIASVYIGGRKVVEAGQAIGIDTAALEAEVATRVDAVRARQAAGAAQTK